MATIADVDVGSEAEHVIERMRRVAPSRALDREKAEAALAQYLAALGLDLRPVRWIEAEGDTRAPVREGFKAAWESMCRKGRPELLGIWHTAAFDPLYGAGLRKGGLIGSAEKEEKAAGHGVKRQAHKVDKAVGERLTSALNLVSRHFDVARAVEEALNEKGIVRRTTMIQAIGTPPEVQRARQDAEMNAEIAIGDAAGQAAQAAHWFARAHCVRSAGKPADALERAASALVPLVDAVEAGLWLFWVADDEVIAVARPNVE